MPSSKEEYWNKKNEEKAFRELYWSWHKECIRRFGRGFVSANSASFTQKSFRGILEQYNDLESAREAMLSVNPDGDASGFTPEQGAPSEETSLPEISTTATEEDD